MHRRLCPRVPRRRAGGNCGRLWPDRCRKARARTGRNVRLRVGCGRMRMAVVCFSQPRSMWSGSHRRGSARCHSRHGHSCLLHPHYSFLKRTGVGVCLIELRSERCSLLTQSKYP
eukprot:1279542-Pleurochrysis_carterae.AAC.5